MATALQGLRLTARSCAGAPFSSKCVARAIGKRRVFSTTSTQWKANNDSAAEAAIISKAEQAGFDLRSKQAEIENSAADIQNYLNAELDFGPPAPEFQPPKKKLKETFLNMGDPEPFDDGGFAEDMEDDLSSLAHGELQQHREWRHYARLAAWEMPLLSRMPFPTTSHDLYRIKY